MKPLRQHSTTVTLKTSSAARKLMVLVGALIALCLMLVLVAPAFAAGESTGVVLKNNTSRYSDESQSNVLDQVGEGTLLSLAPVSANWYKSVGSDGVSYFIKAQDVSILEAKAKADGSRDSFKGTVISTVAPLYKAPIKTATQLKTHAQGIILKYYDFNDDWYMVMLSSGAIAYLSHDDVLPFDMTQDSANRAVYQGVTLAQSTAVYKAPTTNAGVIKTYSQGTILQFSRYADGWYMAAIDNQIAYIPASSLMVYTASTKTAQSAYAQASMPLYKAPTTNAQLVANLDAGTQVTYIHWDREGNWGAASYNGTYVYFPLKTGLIGATKPAANKGIGGGKITTYKVGISLNTMASQIATRKNYLSGSYNPSSEALASWINPNSFDVNSRSYYQFADLRSASNITAEQLNRTLSKCSNGLYNTGAYFVEAEQTYGVNAVYLAAHAILETGWGSSTLAQGFYYDSNKYSHGDNKTYYNFFGYGAYDYYELSGGFSAAVKCGWNSPRKAIVEAADALGGRGRSYGYIYHGQETVYEMRFAPEAEANGYAGYKYATDVQWANNIALLMGQIYAAAGVDPGMPFIVPTYN